MIDKDILTYQGNQTIYGSRDATRAAFKLGLIENGETWMSMIKSRNQTSHTYNEETAQAIIEEIISNYYREFIQLQNKFETLRANEEQN